MISMGVLWQAAAETFAAPVVGAVLSPLSARGKGPVAETSASDNSLTTPALFLPTLKRRWSSFLSSKE